METIQDEPTRRSQPIHDERLEDGAGVAVRVTCAAGAKPYVHAVPQVIPRGSDVMEPEPAPDFLRTRA
jgi:hypothetical protein